MNQIIVSDNKIKPYFIETLGCERLSSHDIAKSLKIDPFVVHQKIKRPAFQDLLKDNGYRNITAVIKRITQGRPEKLCYLETRAAKAFVATYNSKEGHRYLDFLFDCEQVIQEELPKLLEQNKFYKSRITQLEALRSQKALPNRSTMLTPVFKEDLFGQMQLLKMVKVDVEELSTVEKIDSELINNERIIHGLSKKNERLNFDRIKTDKTRTGKILKLLK